MLEFDHKIAILMVALLIDLTIGDPNFIWKRLPHPVALFGMAIKFGDNLLNRQHSSEYLRKWLGGFLIILLCCLSISLGLLLTIFLAESWLGLISITLIASIFISQKSLYNHAYDVYIILVSRELEEGRIAVSRIVGRDTSKLDESGISRAAVESIAENFSDGVVAPAFWFAIFGLPGLLTYKMINTADSMIGHMSEKYREFGWATAKLDDLVNLIPSRLSGILIALCAPIGGGSITQSLGVIMADANKHVSPNAGWPESAMAGALNIALSGPRTYESKVVDSPWINKLGRRTLVARDIAISLNVFIFASALHVIIVTVLFYLLFNVFD